MHGVRAARTTNVHEIARDVHGTPLAAYRSATSRTPNDAVLR
ncbi:hypothetical protein BURMUCGD2_2872 [Burkholderia multivorans CGD2]|uniref:Uncharacterized protein n=1 Tax=Burkholderia multivorans CGD2 TaxID=513052 RepID=B9BSU8_9BURK|nr:hypothetical protein BURMUCGD2_2872 [Burkholderia multivorans CGD2]